MIARIIGRIIHQEDRFVVLETGGVGYRLRLSAETKKSIAGKKEVSLWTHLAVRENSWELYGFNEKEELNIFELLITLPGVGPKSALTILSLAPPATLKRAVIAGDSDYLTKVSGIGPKSAEKIVAGLKDKLETDNSDMSDADGTREETEALEALRSLGYGPKESRLAIKRVPSEIKETAAKIKAALRVLTEEKR